MPAISAADGPVAVTGVSGYTGGHLVRHLVHHGYTVRACLRDSSSWRGLDAVQYLEKLPGVEIMSGCDLFVAGSFDSAFEGCSAVFHVAAVLGNSAQEGAQPHASGHQGEYTYAGGLEGTQNVIDAVNKSGSVQRLIFTSSMGAVANQSKEPGHEWTKLDWASDGRKPEEWPGDTGGTSGIDEMDRTYYAKSKVDTEVLVNDAASASGGAWDVVTINPAMICGPILFAAQNGQWIEMIGQLAAGETVRNMSWNIIDVRDLCAAHRLAAESRLDHAATVGGARYIMHGSGGPERRPGTGGSVELAGEMTAIIRASFPGFVVVEPQTRDSKTSELTVVRAANPQANDSKQAKELLGVTLRPVEEAVRV